MSQASSLSTKMLVANILVEVWSLPITLRKFSVQTTHAQPPEIVTRESVILNSI